MIVGKLYRFIGNHTFNIFPHDQLRQGAYPIKDTFAKTAAEEEIIALCLKYDQYIEVAYVMLTDGLMGDIMYYPESWREV